MKVYYDLAEGEIDEKFIEENTSSFEGEEKEKIKNLYRTMSNTLNSLKKTMSIKIKYQIMWGLRSIENEFDDEEGCIIITKEGKIHTKDFTPDLTDKIHHLLSLVKFE